MLIYKSVYRWEQGVCLGEVVDFPGTVAAGATIEEARHALAEALKDMAETNLLRGESLPVPNPAADCVGHELDEPIYLLLQAGNLLKQDALVTTK